MDFLETMTQVASYVHILEDIVARDISLLDDAYIPGAIIHVHRQSDITNTHMYDGLY